LLYKHKYAKIITIVILLCKYRLTTTILYSKLSKNTAGNCLIQI